MKSVQAFANQVFDGHAFENQGNGRHWQLVLLASYIVVLVLTPVSALNAVYYNNYPDSSLALIMLFHHLGWLPWVGFSLLLHQWVFPALQGNSSESPPLSEQSQHSIAKVLILVPLVMLIPVCAIETGIFQLLAHLFLDVELTIERYLAQFSSLTIWYTCMIFFAFFYGNYAFFAFLQQQKQTQYARRLEQENLRYRLENIQHHFNPHFIFNCLNNISALVNLNHNQQATEAIKQLSLILRKMLTKGDIEHSLADEIQIIGIYVYLLKLRFGDTVRLNMNMPPEAKEKSIPAFLLLTLVENAVTHGHKHPIEITIVLYFKDNKMHITIINKCSEQATEGCGTQTLHRIREMLVLWYQDQASLVSVEKNGFHEVALCIPAARP